MIQNHNSFCTKIIVYIRFFKKVTVIPNHEFGLLSGINLTIFSLFVVLAQQGFCILLLFFFLSLCFRQISKKPTFQLFLYVNQVHFHMLRVYLYLNLYLSWHIGFALFSQTLKKPIRLSLYIFSCSINW